MPVPTKQTPKLVPTVRPIKVQTGGSGPVRDDVPSPRPPAAKGEKVRTGVPGLDELLSGGLERCSTTLVMGGAGCGKTTLASQFLYNGATQYDEPGVLLSFEETSESVMRHMGKYGFDFKSLAEQNTFASISYRPHEVRKLVEEGGGLILDTLSSLGAKRLVIDPITPYTMLFETEYSAREAEMNLFELLKKWKCTTLVTAEGLRSKSDRMVGMVYLADCVILMHHPRHRTSRYRAIEVLKMRGGKQSEQLCPFEIVEGFGVKVYPGERIFYDVEEGD